VARTSVAPRDENPWASPPRRPAVGLGPQDGDPRVKSLAYVEIPREADERTTLMAFVDWQRATLQRKCDGLTPEQLRRRAVPPSTLSLLGLVRHMAEVERSWFRARLNNEHLEPLYSSADDPDGDFDNVDTADVDEAFARWHEFVRRGELVLRGTSPIPALYRGFVLHADDAADPYVFRVDLSNVGIGSARIVFGRDPRTGAMRVHLDVMPMSLEKQPAIKDSRWWITGALGALGVETATVALRRRSRDNRRDHTDVRQ
jgi:uncharacterized protein DUF664